MTASEEAALRAAIAERERHLAAALTRTGPDGVAYYRHDQLQSMRNAIERLRAELQR